MQRLMDWWEELPRYQRLLGLLMVGGLMLGLWGVLRPGSAASSTGLGTPPPPATTGMASSSGTGSTRASRPSAGASGASHDTQVWVDVQGAVNHPGLYQFAQGMRVADALKTAGGLTPRADRRQINLALRLTDQQQLYVPLKGEKAPATTAVSGTGGTGTPASGATSGSGSSGAPVNLNTATVTELQQLTGVGAKKAQKIVDYRTEHGPFKSVKDLTQVAGFGEKTVAHLQAQLTT
ncbi:helix-hairpin-helix domain-containing protein [Levilactobacillus zymae]|uniref:helix-hairpin-helix domain-containing protein n=1 Tax=Levilactobacillus zymae TaxID=267363 RepID=UPI0028B7273D|nr:helix-hairpin-helix domain-containing protein [Levilactobacillus zymae]MDT6980410.1 helix-hairpin-helix domain-containing protein [Levilactobacillus zymae]